MDLLPSILVTIRQALGSTPREAGAWMRVGINGTEGTIGGGRLEWDAIETARAMLRSGAAEEQRSVALGPEIGQCCGGRVDLRFERLTTEVADRLSGTRVRDEASRPSVFIFGAGHTGRALANALAPLPFASTIVDTRPETLVGLPETIAARATPIPESLVETAPSGSAFLVMTHDHGLDFLIAAAALARRDAAYVGMIGSATKRARFAGHLREHGRAADIDRLTLPIGGSALRDKRPAVIATLVAAELAICLLSNQQEIAAHSLGSGADAVQ